jgi:hypothetical protein
MAYIPPGTTGAAILAARLVDIERLATLLAGQTLAVVLFPGRLAVSV